MPSQENNNEPVRVFSPHGEEQITITEAQLEAAIDQILEDDPPTPIPEVPQPTEVPPIPEGMREHIWVDFTCPHCEHSTEYLRATTATTGYDTAYLSASTALDVSEEEFRNLRLSWEGNRDAERSGEVEWECEDCGHSLSFEEMQGGVNQHRELIPIEPPRNRARAIPGGHTFKVSLNDGTTRKLAPNEENYHILAGNESGLRHPAESLPESFSPEVISPYVHKNDPYGYALTATCPECEHSFMVGPEDHSINCPKCSHEFQISPLNRPIDAQNAQERRRRFGASFG